MNNEHLNPSELLPYLISDPAIPKLQLGDSENVIRTDNRELAGVEESLMEACRRLLGHLAYPTRKILNDGGIEENINFVLLWAPRFFPGIDVEVLESSKTRLIKANITRNRAVKELALESFLRDLMGWILSRERQIEEIAHRGTLRGAKDDVPTICLRLLRNLGSVNAGEFAGYAAAEADTLVRMGVAEIAVPKEDTASLEHTKNECLLATNLFENAANLAEVRGDKELASQIRAEGQKRILPVDAFVRKNSERQDQPIPKVEEPKFSHNDDFTVVDWRGERFHFSPGNQAKTVGSLCSDFERGFDGLTPRQIKDCIGSSANSFRVDHLFRKTENEQHPGWGTFIVWNGKGPEKRYKLNLK